MKILKLSLLAIFFLVSSAGAGDLEVDIINVSKIAKQSNVFIYPVAQTSKKEKSPAGNEKQGSGSGTIIATNGLILTNQHVVDHAKEVNVEFFDGTVLVGKVLGIDETFDLAVVQVTGKKVTVAKLGNSDALVDGQWVVAMGNPFGLKFTTTKGIISAVHRDDIGLNQFEDFLQTDTPINPGNSGGGLFNLKGELIGVNTAIINYSQGIGFAIPINVAKIVAPELIQYGKFKHAWIGIGLQDMNKDLSEKFDMPERSGVVVSEVFPGSPAEASKLEVGDIILSLNGKPIPMGFKLKNMVSLMKPGTAIVLEVSRLAEIDSGAKDNKRVTITVSMTLTERVDEK